MSSAILYLAIVAIWACVLIPRWLRRDSAPGAAVAFADAPDASPVVADSATGSDSGAGTGANPDSDSGAGDVSRPLPAARPVPALTPANGEESRRRMLAARRRLLGMLILLEAAAISLAVIGLAAMWVVVPPTIMLVGYLLLLREAAQADAEHAQREAAAIGRARARAQAPARSRPAGRVRAGQHPTRDEGIPLAGVAAPATGSSPSAAELVATFAAAPVPADYEDSGRDFAPGLAGKYTTSNTGASNTDDDLAEPAELAEPADEDHYGYEEPRLRAVGD